MKPQIYLGVLLIIGLFVGCAYAACNEGATQGTVTDGIPAQICKGGVWKSTNAQDCTSGTSCLSGSCINGICCDGGQCGYAHKCFNQGETYNVYSPGVPSCHDCGQIHEDCLPGAGTPGSQIGPVRTCSYESIWKSVNGQECSASVECVSGVCYGGFCVGWSYGTLQVQNVTQIVKRTFKNICNTTEEADLKICMNLETEFPRRDPLVYVVPDADYKVGSRIPADVTGEGAKKIIIPDCSNPLTIPIWHNPRPGTYRVIIDINEDGIIDLNEMPQKVTFSVTFIPCTTTTTTSTTTRTTTTTTTTTTSTTTTILGALKVFKFNDYNKNGIWESGEPGLGGFKFTITGPISFILVSDDFGEAFAYNLPMGTYTITEDLPAGWLVTTPNPQIIVINTQILKEAKFGNRQIPATTTSTTSTTTTTKAQCTKCIDDTVCGAKNVYGQLCMCGMFCDIGETCGDYICKLGEKPTTTTSTTTSTTTTTCRPTTTTTTTTSTTSTTAPLCVKCVDNTKCGEHNNYGQMCNCAVKCVDYTGGCNYVCELGEKPTTTTSTTTKTTTTVPPKGKLKVFKWNDYNMNGIWETSEPVLGGFQFRVTGPINFTLVTDEWGEVFAYNLPYGTYTVTENVPAGWTATTPNPQSILLNTEGLKELKFGNKQIPASTTSTTTTSTTTTSSTTSTTTTRPTTTTSLCTTTTTRKSTTTTIPVTTTSSTTTPTTTTLMTGDGKLKIFKWNDYNMNGIWETGEPPLGGFRFTVSGPVDLSATTDEWGEVFIYNLPYGQYTVTEKVPAGWTVTTKNPQTIVLNSKLLREVMFGNRQVPASTTTTINDMCGKQVSGSPSESETKSCTDKGGRFLCGNGWCSCYCGQATTSTTMNVCGKKLSGSPSQSETKSCTDKGGKVYCGNGWCGCFCGQVTTTSTPTTTSTTIRSKNCDSCRDGTVCDASAKDGRTCVCSDVTGDDKFDSCVLKAKKPACKKCTDGTASGAYNSRGQICRCKDTDFDGNTDSCSLFKKNGIAV